MRITHFFTLLFLFSVSMFVFLKPQAYIKSDQKEVPELEIEDFTVYKLDEAGVESVLSGTSGDQYETHMNVEHAHYIQNKNKFGENLYADRGRFEKEIAYLDENVRYYREDGLSFESEHAVYNTKKEYLYVADNFTLTQNENIIYGKELHYYSKTGKSRAQKIEANYYYEDKE